MRTFALFLILMAQDEKGPQFEVASIKPSAPDARGMWIRNNPGGRVNITNMTLKELIQIAYQVQPYQVSGGPAWLDSVHFDIIAKAENTPKQGELPLMLQALLADRFQLTIRHETKELAVYGLVLARKDGKLGPKLIESTDGSCEKFDPAKPQAPPQPGQPRPNYCGSMMMQIPADAPKPPPDAAGPSIFTALQEQLGLKLDSQKGPVEILVVGRAEKPSEN